MRKSTHRLFSASAGRLSYLRAYVLRCNLTEDKDIKDKRITVRTTRTTKSGVNVGDVRSLVFAIGVPEFTETHALTGLNGTCDKDTYAQRWITLADMFNKDPEEARKDIRNYLASWNVRAA